MFLDYGYSYVFEYINLFATQENVRLLSPLIPLFVSIILVCA